jgi:hypothetical protein
MLVGPFHQEGSGTAFVPNRIWRSGMSGVSPTKPFSIGVDRLANWCHRSGLGR